MGEWYGKRVKVGDQKFLELKEIRMNFWSEEQKVYHNDWETKHYFQGDIKISATRTANDVVFKPFGLSRAIPNTSSFTVRISQLPQELQDEMKQLWMKVEKAMIEMSKEGEQ